MYQGNEKLYNYDGADIIITHVLNLCKVDSAIDVGCCLGVFSKVLKQKGVRRVKSLDQGNTNKDILGKHIDLQDFVEFDLNAGVYHDKDRYDLAVCLEVAEHIDPKNEMNVVETLVGLSDVILFSAAIPGQGGDGHLNEQWPSYWRRLFGYFGYKFIDVVRPFIWDNDIVYKWYRQNTFLVAKTDIANQIWNKYNMLDIENNMIDVVHPLYYTGNKKK